VSLLLKHDMLKCGTDNSPSSRKLEGDRGTIREGSNWIFRYGLQGQYSSLRDMSWLTFSETLCDASVLVRYLDI
jgi:hypothetical protein